MKKKFRFTRYDLSPSESRWERFFQIIPGLLSWGSLIGIVLLSIVRPMVAAIIMIAFIFYWLLRLFYVTIFMTLSFFQLSAEQETDWPDRIRKLDDYLQTLDFPAERMPFYRFRRWLSERSFRKTVLNLKKEDFPPRSEELVHLVLIPVSKETRDIVEPGIESIHRQNYSKNKIMIILAVEQRAPADVKQDMENLVKDYQRDFMGMMIAEHPENIPGEARVKGANITFAAKQAAEFFKRKDIPYENVIVSCFDADTVVSKQYFSCLTFYFMACPYRLRASFQPIPVYHNNIWQTTGFARVLEMGASIFQLMEATNPEKLVTFSSHSMSFKALVDVDYWPLDMISDDSAIFWKAFIYYEGEYRVVPMQVTVSMDVISAESLWKTAVSVYRQKRRWAWGVENFPIVMRGFMKTNRLSFFNKFRYGIKLLEGHVAWATWPFMLTVMGWLPPLFARQEFLYSVVYYNAPRITGLIFNMASISLVITITLSLCLLPKSKVRHSLFKRIQHAFEWLLVPFIAIFFSGLPALDAQTRLMFGRYMEFWVTDKAKIKSFRKS